MRGLALLRTSGSSGNLQQQQRTTSTTTSSSTTTTHRSSSRIAAVSSPSARQMDASFAPEEVTTAFAGDVEVMAPGAVDAGLFEADASAAALLAELESVSAQLGSFLDAEPAGLDLAAAAAAWAGDDDGTSGMTQAENGMFNTTVRTH